MLLRYSCSEANFQSFGLISLVLRSTGGRRSSPGWGSRQSAVSPPEGSKTGLTSEKSECDAEGRSPRFLFKTCFKFAPLVAFLSRKSCVPFRLGGRRLREERRPRPQKKPLVLTQSPMRRHPRCPSQGKRQRSEAVSRVYGVRRSLLPSGCSLRAGIYDVPARQPVYVIYF